MQPPAPSLDDLLAEMGWLRRFALHLTQDPEAAGDLAQDTLIAALRDQGDRSGGALGHPRAWLATVARRLAGSGRRRDRVRRGADATALSEAATHAPGADELAERLELQRLVGEAMLGLEEPYRGTLYAIYFRGARPEEVARESGVSAGTVRWRAFRARELVREALVRRSARTWNQLALQLGPVGDLAGRAVHSAADHAVLHVAMPMTIKSIATGVAAGGLLAFVSHKALPRPEEPRLSAPPSSQAGELAPLRTPSVAIHDPGPGAEKSARARVTAPSIPSGISIARGWLRSDGGEVAGATLRFNRGEDTRSIKAERNAWAVEGLAPGPWEVEVTSKGFAPLLATMEVPASSLLEQDFVLLRTGSFAVRILDEQGAPLPVTLGSSMPVAELLSVLAVDDGGEAAGTWRGRTFQDALPEIPSDTLGLVILEKPLPLTLELRYGSEVIDDLRVSELRDVVPWRVNPALLRQAEREVTFRALADADAGLRVSATLKSLPGDMAFPSSVKLGDDGVAADLRLPPGSYQLALRQGSAPAIYRSFKVGAEAVDLGELSLAPGGDDR